MYVVIVIKINIAKDTIRMLLDNIDYQWTIWLSMFSARLHTDGLYFDWIPTAKWQQAHSPPKRRREEIRCVFIHLTDRAESSVPARSVKCMKTHHLSSRLVSRLWWRAGRCSLFGCILSKCLKVQEYKVGY